MTQKIVNIDASTFQKPLGKLAEVLSQKVKREAPKLLGVPGFVAFDLHVLTRQAQYTYDLIFYLNADERRKTDCDWKPAYSVVTLPLIRNMIDSLYNITAILQDPNHNGPWFRKYGYQKFLKGLNEDQARYGGKPEWDEWIARGRDEVDFEMRKMGFAVSDVLAEKEWPTLGQYITRKQKGGTFTPHQEFLTTGVRPMARIFCIGSWSIGRTLANGDFLHRGLIAARGETQAGGWPSAITKHAHRPRLQEISRQL